MGLGAVVSRYEVVLATCNGEAFVGQQIASIFSQTLLPARLLVADDRSTDGTLGLLQKLQSRAPIPFEILPAVSAERLGSCRNFERLLEATSADYVMPADQDDLWDSDKAARLLKAMRKLEQSWGVKCPLLVHADLRVIDDVGRLLAHSYHGRQGEIPAQKTWLEIGMQNCVTGCASLLNRACIDRALPFPPEAVLHDWWLAQVAAHQGGIAYLPAPCMSYRQHATNVVGAIGLRRILLRRLHELWRTKNLAAVAEARIGPGLRQLRACVQRFAPDPMLLPSGRQHILIDQLWSSNPWRRLCAALSLRLRKHGIWRTCGFYAALFYWQPQQR
jgi:glycosyltransferase involved in cell wall biosynthesis